jgi:Hemerythrin HHE cation binding domain
MTTKRRGRQRADIETQHRELREMVAAIEATGELMQLVPLLEALRTQLQAHFAGEERADGGLVEAVGASAPRHLRRLDELLGEHARLLEAVDELIARGRTLVNGAVRDLVRDTRAVSRQLERHEARETELLTDAIYADIGGG